MSNQFPRYVSESRFFKIIKRVLYPFIRAMNAPIHPTPPAPPSGVDWSEAGRECTAIVKKPSPNDKTPWELFRDKGRTPTDLRGFQSLYWQARDETIKDPSQGNVHALLCLRGIIHAKAKAYADKITGYYESVPDQDKKLVKHIKTYAQNAYVDAVEQMVGDAHGTFLSCEPSTNHGLICKAYTPEILQRFETLLPQAEPKS